MIENKNQPAFPISEEATDRVIDEVRIFTGVTKLEFFACNAPVEIPSWFEHVAPKNTISEMYNADDITNEEDKKEIKAWLYDPIYDLPEHLKWFSDRIEEISHERAAYEVKNNAARYFQWRVYYAEQLLAELSKPQP
jgi:hypothetical protein